MGKIDYEDTGEVTVTTEQIKSLGFLATKHHELAMSIEDMEIVVKGLRAEKLNLETNLIPDVMQEAKMAKFTLTNGVEIKVVQDLAVSVTEKNKPTVFAWLKKSGNGSLVKGTRVITFDATEGEQRDEFDALIADTEFAELMNKNESVHSGSLKAFCKQYIEDHGKFPKPIEKAMGIYEYTTTKIKLPKNFSTS